MNGCDQTRHVPELHRPPADRLDRREGEGQAGQVRQGHRRHRERVRVRGVGLVARRRPRSRHPAQARKGHEDVREDQGDHADGEDRGRPRRRRQAHPAHRHPRQEGAAHLLARGRDVRERAEAPRRTHAEDPGHLPAEGRPAPRHRRPRRPLPVRAPPSNPRRRRLPPSRPRARPPRRRRPRHRRPSPTPRPTRSRRTST